MWNLRPAKLSTNKGLFTLIIYNCIVKQREPLKGINYQLTWIFDVHMIMDRVQHKERTILILQWTK